MYNFVVRAYRNLAWWADEVPLLRWMKCVFGRHAPGISFSTGVDEHGNTVHVDSGREHCLWCGKDMGMSRD